MTFNNVTPNAILLKSGARQKTKKIYSEYGSIPGSSVEYFIDDEEYIGHDRTLEFLVKDQDELPGLFELFNGAGNLVIETGGFYKARVTDTVHSWEAKTCGWSRLAITFRIAPFFWLDSGKNAQTLTPPTTIENPGYKAEPYIRVYGSGDINLTINGRTIALKNISEYIELDSEAKIAYKGTLNLGDDTIGPFPYLDPGLNSISAPGATSIQIIPRWREL